MVHVPLGLSAWVLSVWVLGLLLLVGTVPADADEIEVDLALVLAVDVSQSMETEEQLLQREGFIEAFRSPEVHAAIRGGMLGRIAVAYVEWAGAADQRILVPWTVIEDSGDAHGFADRLAREATRRGGYTSLSAVIDLSVQLLRASGFRAVRQAIDISGDGANNQGRNVTKARDEAVAAGMTINGLPIMLKRPSGAWDIEDLDLYFRDCVIGGPGAFMIPVRERHQLIQAIRTKIIREIVEVPDVAPRLQPAQSDRRADCLAGENRVRQRYGN
ncbi:DUF1194 domain-containing protein [Microvirga makkahensis]|uniref:DUF1194 domain-containing protein n=1 Tax=Microvirga makkahensis TaxID=1128670 RepID=A0A7X3SR96_9HYPH|nr:DUF1194 domain-containing protein [Microvirga makkahensis]MXQ14103.1 DUF1194 domain-containing protein [Microvirga makkahensis]